jgi:eukaryotic-like serine/threonine-protein kinase
MPGPAERLAGRILDGWEVVERIDNFSASTSVGYRVVGPDGQPAYLKAYDFSRAFGTEDFAAAIEEIAGSYRFERNLVDRCAEQGMSRVVRGLGHGEVAVDDAPLPVMYIVFELAEGDLRDRLQSLDRTETAAKLQTLHQAAVGLRQMHAASMYHQDMKPANVFTFADDGAKVGDLGHACDEGEVAPLGNDVRPGDSGYAPPECLYPFQMPDVRARRQARDMYLFGSLILFSFAEVSATSALLSKLPPRHRPGFTRDSFDDVMPYLIEAFDQVVEEFVADVQPDPVLVLCLRELCHPDPRQRGDSKGHSAKHGNPYSLERYVTRLNLLHRRAPGADARVPKSA